MMKRIFLAGAISLSSLSSFVPASHAAGAEHFFDRLEGSWRGTGFVKPSIESKEESIRCKMRNTRRTDKTKLTLTGNCVIGGFIFSLNGWIKQDGKKNSYFASMFQSIVSLKVDSFSGKRSGKKLSFSFKGRDRTSNEKVAASIVIVTRKSGGFDVQVNRTDPKTKKNFKVGTIKFKQR